MVLKHLSLCSSLPQNSAVFVIYFLMWSCFAKCQLALRPRPLPLTCKPIGKYHIKHCGLWFTSAKYKSNEITLFLRQGLWQGILEVNLSITIFFFFFSVGISLPLISHVFSCFRVPHDKLFTNLACSALGRICTELAALGPNCHDLRPIFSSDDPPEIVRG